jgi:two-component system response regulator (stage 0 sporulation protein F)
MPRKRRRKKILWVDDQVESFKSFVSALREAGFDVSTAESTDTALEVVQEEDFDAALVDILMPPPDGIELLRRLNKRYPKMLLAALSSYLYLERYRKELRQLDFDVELLDKDIPVVGSEDFDERFINPIKDFLAHGVTQTIDEEERRLSSVEGVDPFDIPLVEFMKKSIVEKDKLAEKAYQLQMAAIKREFQLGKIWVLICGRKGEIRATATTPSEILSEEQMMNFARSQQRPPYQFFEPVDVDDIWTKCGARIQLQDYPTVTLVFGKEELKVHFDTGAPWTFFSYEELLRLGEIRPTTIFGTGKRGGRNYKAIPLRVRVRLRSQSDGQTTDVTLIGQTVRDWDRAPFARICDEKCEHYEQDGRRSLRRSCPERRALIGRNLMTENKIALVLDGRTRETSLPEKK